jgi:hypothetical protein
MEPTDSDSSARPPRPKVIYVMGAGRSGSTILGVTLGNCEDVFFAGELDKWVPRNGIPKLEDVERRKFWAGVRTRISEPEALSGLQVRRQLERSSALLRVRGRSARRRLREPYARFMNELFVAVARTAGASCVVDTSHYPLRARRLQSLDGIDLYLLFLVRHPPDVIASFARRDVVERRFSPNTTRAYLLLTYLLSTWVFRKQRPERRLLLFYEDFLEDPDGILREILDWVGSSAAIPDFTALHTGLPLHGNRLIDGQVVSLARRRAPREEARARGRLFGAFVVAALGRLRPRAQTRSSS